MKMKSVFETSALIDQTLCSSGKAYTRAFCWQSFTVWRADVVSTVGLIIIIRWERSFGMFEKKNQNKLWLIRLKNKYFPLLDLFYSFFSVIKTSLHQTCWFSLIVSFSLFIPLCSLFLSALSNRIVDFSVRFVRSLITLGLFLHHF